MENLPKYPKHPQVSDTTKYYDFNQGTAFPEFFYQKMENTIRIP